MRIIMIIPAEALCFFVLFSSILGKKFFPDIPEFWMSVGAAIALFGLMQIRALLESEAASEENASR